MVIALIFLKIFRILCVLGSIACFFLMLFLDDATIYDLQTIGIAYSTLIFFYFVFSTIFEKINERSKNIRRSVIEVLVMAFILGISIGVRYN